MFYREAVVARLAIPHAHLVEVAQSLFIITYHAIHEAYVLIPTKDVLAEFDNLRGTLSNFRRVQRFLVEAERIRVFLEKERQPPARGYFWWIWELCRFIMRIFGAWNLNL